jgi:mannose-6-phosphate isomerase-like protein (cupin superfamily)
MSLRVVRGDEGTRADVGPFGVRIIEDGSGTGHRMGLIEATVPPGPAQPPQHVHREHDEVFIVTAGKLRFTGGDESVDVEAGSVVVVPPGVAHTFSNPFAEPAVFLCVLTPDQYLGYFREMSALAVSAQGLPSPADIGQVMSRYATEVVRAER